MDVCFEISDRDYEELGPWPLAVGQTARAQLYAFRDHSLGQQGGRLLLPDLALAPDDIEPGLRRVGPVSAVCTGQIVALQARRGSGSERRDETTIQLECGVPICLMLQVRRWDAVDAAPAIAPPGIEFWRAARPLRVGDNLSGVLDLQEVAFEVGDVSSFPLLDDRAPDYPVEGVVTLIERLDLDPSSGDYGALAALEDLPEDLFWPHRYFVTLSV